MINFIKKALGKTTKNIEEIVPDKKKEHFQRCF